MTVQAAFAATLVDEWCRCGVTDAVVAPGSRSTPLALALAADGRLRVHVVLDERSAAFFAVGIGMASGRPAVMLTTSGTAAAELHPAVVEAHQARVPLIACTADRPPELHHVGAPQTIEQANLFVGAVRWAVEPGVARAASSGVWRSLAARSVAEATASRAGPGPVHLNLAFAEPLVGDAASPAPGRAGGGPWHRAEAGRPAPPAQVVAELAAGGRGVIVAGAGAGDPAAVNRLATVLGWPLLADPRSGCRLPAPATVAAADALLRVESFAAAHRPDVVVRLGAPWVSRTLADWLARLEVPQYLVDPFGAWLDPARTATTVVAADPTVVCGAVADADVRPAPPAWAAAWRRAEAAAQAAFDRALEGHDEPTEPGVARAVADVVPDGSTVVVASSMPVRDVEWYARPRSGLRVVSNRGANGIDGVTSTALGVAAAGPGPTVGLVGDLAFLHDTNALLVPRGAAEDLQCTVVVVDNDGGGIFSFLPQARHVAPERFEQLLGTPQGVDLARLAAVYGVSTAEVSTADQLGPAVTDCLAAGDVRLVHVRTDRARNVEVHDELHAAVAAALTGSGSDEGGQQGL